MSTSRSGLPFFATLALLLALPCAQADDFDTWPDHPDPAFPARVTPGFQGVQRLGFTIGGSAISTITFPDGAVREISAGGLNQIGFGVLYRARSAPLSAGLTLNYHYDSDYNNGDNADFRRVPLEALLYFHPLQRLRIGAGLRYVYAARASSTLNGVTEKIAFANAHGSIVELGYQVRPYGWVTLRYVDERYRVESYTTSAATPPPSSTATYNGSHVGLFVSYEY